MARIAAFFKSIPRVLVGVGIVALGLIALFVAWWIAVVLVLGFALYAAVRRMLTPAPRGAPAVIEGEFRIAREDSLPRDRSGS